MPHRKSLQKAQYTDSENEGDIFGSENNPYNSIPYREVDDTDKFARVPLYASQLHCHNSERQVLPRKI